MKFIAVLLGATIYSASAAQIRTKNHESLHEWWGDDETSTSSTSYVPPANQNQPRHEPAHEWWGDDETSTSSTSYVPPANQNQQKHEFLWWGES